MNPQKKTPESAFRNLDLATFDLGKAREFYGGLRSWDFRELIPEDPQAGALFHTLTAQGGGMVLEAASCGAGNRPPYFQVDDLEAVVARIWELGGEIVMPPRAMSGGLGEYCIIRDPCGATVGLWQAGGEASPAQPINPKQEETTHGTGT